MLAKLIAHGKSRADAFARLTDALEQTIIAGPRSNLGFLTALCRAGSVRKGDFDTGFIDANLAELCAKPQGLDHAAVAFGARRLLDEFYFTHPREHVSEGWTSPWDATDAFQVSGIRRLALPILADGQAVVAEVAYGPEGAELAVEGVPPARDAFAVSGPDAVYVLRRGRQTKVAMRDLAPGESGKQDTGGTVRAPMHGKILALFVEKGAHVVRGQRVAIIEAMKMEHTVVAPMDGIVAEVLMVKDAQVAEGAKMMVIATAASS